MKTSKKKSRAGEGLGPPAKDLPPPEPLEWKLSRCKQGWRAKLACQKCGNEFWTGQKHVGRRRFCSWECRKVHHNTRHARARANHRARYQQYKEKAKQLGREDPTHPLYLEYKEWGRERKRAYQKRHAQKHSDQVSERDRIKRKNRLIKRVLNMSSKSDKTEMTPAQSAQLRRNIMLLMDQQLSEANEVVLGTRQWSPTQARVFGLLLNKVVPDLNANYVQHEHTSKSLNELTREELEAIAQGESTTTVKGDVIDNGSQQS